MMRNFFLVIGIMFIVASAHAATYEWTDSQGGKHFTDDPDKIPAKYRQKSRKIDVEPPVEWKQPVPPPERQPAASEPMRESLPGGHNETWWRSSFKMLRNDLKKIQDKLPEKRDALSALGRKRTLYHKASDRTAYNGLKDDIDKDEARVTELQKQLADLDADATRAGVPMEWRQ
jgi:hypothetical protein